MKTNLEGFPITSFHKVYLQIYYIDSFAVKVFPSTSLERMNFGNSTPFNVHISRIFLPHPLK